MGGTDRSAMMASQAAFVAVQQPFLDQPRYALGRVEREQLPAQAVFCWLPVLFLYRFCIVCIASGFAPADPMAGNGAGCSKPQFP